MSQQQRNNPFSLSERDVAGFREALRNAGFDESGLAKILGIRSAAGLKDLPAATAMRRTAGETAQETCIRLFVIGAACSPESAARALAPAGIGGLIEGGLLMKRGGRILAAVKLAPVDGLILAFDRSWDGETAEAPDHVMGPSDSARKLAGLTIRTAIDSALDLGAGCGYLAFLAASHAARVVATDVNPRAAAFVRLNAGLNGIGNVEARTGDLFAPVAGETFDLIVSNPPFMISPEDRMVYLSGGMKADDFCRRVAAEAPGHLRDGGHFQMLCNWVELADGDWQGRLEGWFREGGCDAWVLRSSRTDPLTYARNWMDAGRGGGAGMDAQGRLESWLEYYRKEGIAGIGAGAVTLRKRTDSGNWFRCFDGPEKLSGPCGPAMLERMRALDFMARQAADDESLMECALKVSSKARFTQECGPTDEGWAQLKAFVHVSEGLGYVEEIDNFFAGLIVACDGKRTLRAALAKAAAGLGWADGEIPPESAEIARQLVDEGFLVPVEAVR